jgi:hypothetical protein
MEPLLSQVWNWLGSGQQIYSQNAVAALLCVALYGLFISSRGHEPSPWRTRRLGRSPDSVLRGG